jgi:glucose-1-phosphate cytidylyltransferase
MERLPVVILCGGEGTRLREETEFKPKPMIQIGGRPMLVHIMKWYAKFGLNRFVLALGYKQEMIKDYFSRYNEINNDLIVNTGVYKGRVPQLCQTTSDNWVVVMSNTGEHTLKGGRLKRLEKYIDSDTFFLTYGDGIGDIDIEALLKFHRSHGKIATVTGVISPPRFGELTRDGSLVKEYLEKPYNPESLINGGFFVFEKEIFGYLSEDEDCDLEFGPLQMLAAIEHLHVYEHRGQWECLDTSKDLGSIQKTWNSGQAKWAMP